MTARSRAHLWFVPFASLLLGVAACASSDDPDVIHGDLSYPIAQDISKPLTEMAKAVPFEDDDARVREEAEPVRPIPRKALFAHQDDPVVQNFMGSANIPATTVNFEGQGTGLAGSTVNSAPPDTDGDIGPNHYVQIVNQQVTVFSRTGAKLLGPMDTNTIFNGFAGPCATTNDGDGTVRYDRAADRWVIMQFSVNGGSGPFFQCIAVSTTADPTGTYARYAFSYNAFNDYPKTAVWPDAYYVTFNMFPNFQFAGGKVCGFDRDKMLLGQTANMQCFDSGVNFGGLLASDLDGPTPPPAGSPNYVLALGDSANNTDLAFWKLHLDWTTPGNSTFTGPTHLTIPTFTPMGSAKQPSGGSQLDALSDRLMNRFAYRNFGDHEALVANHSVVAGTSGGIRWYELRTPGTTPTIFQQGTYAPDSAFRWMGSIAMDKNGDIALGFSTSSTSINPSIRYTARVPTDAPGTMGQGEGNIVNGTGVQNGGLTRWGDYSSLNIDPLDDCTFWYTAEYMGTTGSFNWRTRVGSFKLATCGNTTANDFTISSDPASQTVAAGASTTYTISTAVLSGTAETVNLSISGVPTGATASFSPPSVTAGGSSTLTITTAATAPASTSQLTITGTAASATHIANSSLTITNNNNPPTVAITSPANNAIVSGTVAIAATASDSDGSVVSVKFDLPDGTSVTDTTSPYNATWNSATVTDGAGYTIKATATDDKGATSVTSVNVTVQNGGPTCINGTFASTDVPKPIPDNTRSGVTSTLAVTGNGNIASLALSLHITHTFSGDLVVTLTSPGGRKVKVRNRQGGSADNIVIDNEAITAFDNQAAAGTWKLNVADRSSGDVGTIDSWSLKIVGNCSPTAHWSGTATPNLTTMDNGSVCTTLNVSATGGDTKVAKLDVSGRHDFRSVLKGTLAHNGTTVEAFPVNTFSAGPGSFSFTNRSIAGLTGDASGTWTLCITDTDALGDTGVLTSWSVHD